MIVDLKGRNYLALFRVKPSDLDGIARAARISAQMRDGAVDRAHSSASDQHFSGHRILGKFTKVIFVAVVASEEIVYRTYGTSCVLSLCVEGRS